MNPLSPAVHLTIPESTSGLSVSSISQYEWHSAQNSPAKAESSSDEAEDNGETPQIRDSIIFSPSSDSLFGRDANIGVATRTQDSIVSSDPDSGADADDTEDQKPNVYINGLPPHFTEDQLLAIVSNFGEIVSVRTFTRGGPVASGYGFVLFKTMAAAEKCIVTLRRSNLHPRLSKVQRPFPIAPSSSGSSLPSSISSSSVSSQGQAGSPVLSFRERMARLEDKKSTNVYIEGLPLSCDKHTLLSLAHPHVIMSSRFMKSKIPNSQTMIAFMRMDTRAAAEAVITSLNGRTVRGWDGAESKVLLRIADTLDQRELRRTEAATRDGNGDESSDRLSIAGATLLSYRGKEFAAAALSHSESSGSDASSGGLATGSASFGSRMSEDGSFGESVQTKQPSAILAYPQPPSPPPTRITTKTATVEQPATTRTTVPLKTHVTATQSMHAPPPPPQRQAPPHIPRPNSVLQQPVSVPAFPTGYPPHLFAPTGYTVDPQTQAAMQLQMQVQLQLLQMHPLQVQQLAAAAIANGLGMANPTAGVDPLYAPYAHPAPAQAAIVQQQQQAEMQRRASWRAQSQIPAAQAPAQATTGGVRRSFSAAATSGGVPLSFGHGRPGPRVSFAAQPQHPVKASTAFQARPMAVPATATTIPVAPRSRPVSVHAGAAAAVSQQAEGYPVHARSNTAPGAATGQDENQAMAAATKNDIKAFNMAATAKPVPANAANNNNQPRYFSANLRNNSSHFFASMNKFTSLRGGRGAAPTPLD